MVHNCLLFFSIGGAEIFVILLVIILFFGAKRIPELARGIGKGMSELKNATNEIQREIRENTKDIDKVKETLDVDKQLQKAIQPNENTPDTKPQDTPISPSNTVSRSK